MSTLDNETKQQLKAMFDQSLNEKLAAMKSEILSEILAKVDENKPNTHVSQRISEIENKLHTFNGLIESFNKLGQHAATCRPDTVKNEIDSIRADMLVIHNNVSQMKDWHATGRGTIKQSAVITDDEYKQLAPARLQAAKLSEIVELVEGRESTIRG